MDFMGRTASRLTVHAHDEDAAIDIDVHVDASFTLEMFEDGAGRLVYLERDARGSVAIVSGDTPDELAALVFERSPRGADCAHRIASLFQQAGLRLEASDFEQFRKWSQEREDARHAVFECVDATETASHAPALETQTAAVAS